MLKWLLAVLVLWTFQAMAAKSDASTPLAYAGTYAIRFCKETCAPATTYRTGTLVLFDSPLRDAQGRPRRKWLEQGQIDGCLVLEPVHGVRGAGWIHPGAAPRRFVAWSIAAEHSMRFELDRSPDAGYLVKLRRTSTGLAGTGTVWTDLPGSAPLPRQDAIQARRLGDADPMRCPRLNVDADAMENVLSP